MKKTFKKRTKEEISMEAYEAARAKLIDTLRGKIKEQDSEDWRKAADPKAQYGSQKPSTFSIPPVSILQLGEAMEHGANKYGRMNWRGTEVKSSVYYNAAMRHLMQWRDGAMVDEDSGLHPLAHVMACCAILIDAEKQDTLFDDRGVDGTASYEILDLTKDV